MQRKLKYYLPETMTHAQEAVLKEVSDRLISYGWTDKFIREWWQTPSRNLNYYCPLEALCSDKFDLVHKTLDRTVALYEKCLDKIEAEKKEKLNIIREINKDLKNNNIKE